MTAQELIRVLQTIPQDKEVIIRTLAEDDVKNIAQIMAIGNQIHIIGMEK